MTHHSNTEFKCGLTVFSAELIHRTLGLNDGTIRQWRKRGFLDSIGEKAGRGYLYHIGDIAYLMILQEMSDVGVKMIHADIAAHTGSKDLVAHALLRAPLIELWASSSADMNDLMNLIRTHPEPLSSLFEAHEELDFQSPSNYLITGGDDIDDWQLIDDLSQIDELEDFNLAVIHLDLRKLADRLINALKRFDPTGDEPPAVKDVPPVAVSVTTVEGFEGEPNIQRFSTGEACLATVEPAGHA